MTPAPVGTRVVVANAMGHLSGARGVMVEMAENLLNGHDCCVLLDWRNGPKDAQRWPLCFYWHELAVEV